MQSIEFLEKVNTTSLSKSQKDYFRITRSVYEKIFDTNETLEIHRYRYLRLLYFLSELTSQAHHRDFSDGYQVKLFMDFETVFYMPEKSFAHHSLKLHNTPGR